MEPSHPTPPLAIMPRGSPAVLEESEKQAPARKPVSAWPIAYILVLEYTNIVQSLLRSYKANIFQALSHPTRIAILEGLRDGELSAGAIQERLGIEQANLSQHLAILRSRQIVVNRKDGNQVFYSLRNPVLLEVLDIMRRYFQGNLAEAVQMLGEIEAEPRRGT
jgi:DNA-binding transcriptional ArsR family regulator